MQIATQDYVKVLKTDYLVLKSWHKHFGHLFLAK